MNRIFLDHAATTPLDPTAFEAMVPWLNCGNPSALYEEGRRSRQAIDEAREVVSSALGCLFAEVMFTSSGTEAANLAILGAAAASDSPTRKRVLLGAAEHHAVLRTAALLDRLGFQAEWIPVDRIAKIRLDELERLMSDDVLLVSAMSANNELGTVQPAREVGEVARKFGALYHCDAVCSSPDDWKEVARHADLATFSAHKHYGPKGVGAIYIRAGTQVRPLTVGGGQEREMRAGTENTAAIVGFGAAIRTARPSSRLPRDRFLDRLIAEGFIPTVPARAETLDGHAHVRLPGVDAETMLILLDRMGVSASSGAACSSGSLEPSHVLLACGYSDREAREGLRFTFGRDSTIDEAEEATNRVIEAARSIRSDSR